MIENSIHHNDLGNCFTGINISNNDEISIHHNMIQNTNVALAFRGVEGADVHHNVLGQNLQRGLNLVNSNNASVHHNTYCQNPVAIRYGPSTVPALFGYPPSSGNVIHYETFLGNATDFFLADPAIGSGNTTNLADSNQSISDPTGTCGF